MVGRRVQNVPVRSLASAPEEGAQRLVALRTRAETLSHDLLVDDAPHYTRDEANILRLELGDSGRRQTSRWGDAFLSETQNQGGG